MGQLFYPHGSAARNGSAVDIDPALAGWTYCGLRVLDLDPGEAIEYTVPSSETAVLPLSGSWQVDVEQKSFQIEGRTDVFSGISGFAYLPIDTQARISSADGGQIALCTAKATRRIDPYVVQARAIPVEVRGGGRATRQINNFLSADSFDADKLIAVEVITPQGDWSSYPPHKHDESTDTEVELEEIYYFRMSGINGTGFFSCYTDDRQINETVTVRDGDTYLVPRGFHGPAAASPFHHMYYLNVMAGPSPKRVWRSCNDPAYAWAQGVLEQQEPDPRLPLTEA